jgi:hypothetical protein
MVQVDEDFGLLHMAMAEGPTSSRKGADATLHSAHQHRNHPNTQETKLMKARFHVVDPLKVFYQLYPGSTYEDFKKAEGGREYNEILHARAAGLAKNGYKHVVAATEVTAGDKDFIVYDNERMEFCYWENGFYPFSADPANFPTFETLEFWAENRNDPWSIVAIHRRKEQDGELLVSNTTYVRDFLGNIIGVGSVIALMHTEYKQMVKGKVTKIGKSKLTIEYLFPENIWERHTYRFPNQVIVIK